jgi:flavodoxin
MKSLVVYYSKSGNTEKVAKAIAMGLKAELKKIEEIEDVSSYDLICIGTPVHAFAPAKSIKKFLKELPDLPGKKGAGFCTMHAVGDKRTLRIIKEGLENKKIKFLGGFSCRGASSIFGDIGPKIFNRGKPNEEDLKKAEDFGKKLLNEVEKF